MTMIQQAQQAGTFAGCGYRLEWYTYKAKYGKAATLDYDAFARMAKQETEGLFNRHLAHEARKMDEWQKKFRPELTWEQFKARGFK